MPVKHYKPTSPAQREMSVTDFSGLTKKKSERALTKSKSKRGSGRNSYGRITVRSRGGGHKRKLRQIDWIRSDKDGVPATVRAIEYDPNRTAFLALLFYADGEKRYILQPEGVKVGDTVISGPDVEAELGNNLPLKNMPLGTVIHNIELKPGKGAQMVRSAGAEARLVSKEENYAQILLPSTEVRRVPLTARATVGTVGNVEHMNVTIGKAGKSRHRGRRPAVRGVVMNPVDHPHGGGEGKAPIGRPSPVTPWGVPTLGKKTRKRGKKSNALIVRKRRR